MQIVFARVIYGLWLVQAAYLTVSSFRARRDTHPDPAQSLGLLFAMIAAGALPRLRVLMSLNIAPVNHVLGLIGVAGCAAGVALQIWARQTLGQNWSQTVSAKEGHELVTSGPYRFVRHPMYAAGFLACLALAAVVGGAFVIALVTVGPIFVWRVGAEDRLMIQQSPEEYLAYMELTKALIPFVW